jgi:hypothetical protein
LEVRLSVEAGDPGEVLEAPPLLSRAQRRFYEERGYVRLPGVFDPDSCETVKDYIWSLMPDRFDRRDRSTWTGRIQDCCFNLPLYQRKGLIRFKDKYGFAKVEVLKGVFHDNPVFRQIFSEVTGLACDRLWVRGLHPNLPMPRWVSVNEALGNRLNPQFDAPERPLVRIPRPPQAPIFGHIDAHPCELGFMVYLDEVPEGGGGLAVWPGSHRLFRHAFKTRYDFLPTSFYKRCLNLLQRYRPTVLGGGRGDVIVVHNRLMHTNSLNTSDRIRHGVLLDLSSPGWREREQSEPEAAWEAERRERFDKTKWITTLPEVQEAIAGYQPNRVNSYLVDHPQLHLWLRRLTQDPTSGPRRAVSRAIRSRREGEVWLVVTQGAEHKTSFKFDAYGSPRAGRYRAFLNGEAVGRSQGGIMVERLGLRPGRNELTLKGRFGVDYYFRVLGTSSPISASPVLAHDRVQGGAREYKVEFEAP